MAHYSDMNELNEILATPVVSSQPTRWERKARDSSRKSQPTGDRFIPTRDTMSSELMQLERSDSGGENKRPGNASDAKMESLTAQTLLRGHPGSSKILSYTNKAPAPSAHHHSKLRVLYSANREMVRVRRKQFRHISSTPERILDAPDLIDDYYINVLSWSSQNVLAVGLGPCIYLWNASTGNISLLCEAEDEEDIVTSVKWMHDGNYLAVGTTSKDVQIWDVAHEKQVRSMKGHHARVGSLAWNNHLLSSGSRDSMIFNHDVRVANHIVHEYRGHQQEVCGLSWSPDGKQLASGGNDNMCCIWDMNQSTPQHTFDHKAAVKALAWCPFQANLLATGAGTADRRIQFFNTNTGALLNSVDTESQVCSLQWSPHSRELLSSHGFSQNQLTVWNYPSLTRIAELTGHTSRVLHTAVSPDGTMVCSAAADETLRFWKVWDGPSKKKQAHPSASKRSMMRSIR